MRLPHKPIVFKLFKLAVVAAILSLFLPLASFSAITRQIKVDGAVELGSTKAQVIKALGKPNCPQKFDFYYKKGECEIIIAFNDKTKLVESIIVLGKNKAYSVGGVRYGDDKSIVKKAFGEPEKLVRYPDYGIECWYYPSRNVNFGFNGDKVSSFSVSNFSWKK